MKKWIGFGLLLVVLCLFIFLHSGKGVDLLILNWGDYMSSDLISSFEKEYQVKVGVATVDSNEQMYQNIMNNTAQYDLVIPSDYMLDQMKEDGLIQKLDESRLNPYMVVHELDELLKSDDCKNYRDYYVPYFWGSLGIMYSKRKAGVEEAVLKHGFKVFFEQDLLPENATVGMYQSSRDALAACELYLGYSLNTTKKEELDACFNLLKNTHFDYWQTDDLKKEVSQGNLDVALVYSGDYFDAFYADLEAEQYENISRYGIYAPKEHNNVFFDGVAIPSTSTNVDLAYEFINYLLNEDHAYENAEYVGYCPTLQTIYDLVFESEDFSEVCEIEAYNPANIIHYPASWVEVYRYLGSDIYAYIESEFIRSVQ